MKKSIRKEMLGLRNSMSIDNVMDLSSKISQKLNNWDIYINSNVIMVYSSFRNEVDTSLIMQNILNSGKTLILPKTIKVERKLLPCVIDDIDELETGEYGIMEPSGCRIIDRDKIDLILVPGAAFDKFGYRIGYGAGYYDRFLIGYNGITAGLCYEFQIVNDAFPNEHDINLDYLISERGIIKTGDN